MIACLSLLLPLQLLGLIASPELGLEHLLVPLLFPLDDVLLRHLGNPLIVLVLGVQLLVPFLIIFFPFLLCLFDFLGLGIFLFSGLPFLILIISTRATFLVLVILLQPLILNRLQCLSDVEASEMALELLLAMPF